MYTIDDEQKDLYEDEYYENSKWDNYKGLIFKIIIIILCIIVLVWLIKALKNNNKTSDNGVVHVANTEKIRLAAEDYFFLKNNKNNTTYVSLGELKNKGYITDVVDANNKVCSDSGTKVNLDNEVDAYKMTINFSCSTNDKDEVFYYHKNTLACLNCAGNTHMNGKTVVIADEDENEVYEEIPADNPYYSCTTWSNWTKTRESDRNLIERKKVLVQGVKYGSKTVYGNWSEYTTVPIVKNNGIEIETKTVTEEVLSPVKTARSIDTSNPNIKIISVQTVTEEGNTCKDGKLIDNNCYSTKEKVGNLTYMEYHSENYKINNGYCEDAKTLKNSEGKYVLTYINCRYNEKISSVDEPVSYTVYNYQEKEVKNVTYYRYRTVNTVSEPDKYTDKLYEESDLPKGYVKVDGSEETYYSYKDSYCEK